MENLRVNLSPTQRVTQMSSNKTPSPQHFSIHMPSDSITPTQPPRLIKTTPNSLSKKSSPDFTQGNDPNSRKNVSSTLSDTVFIDRQAEISGPSRSSSLPLTSSTISSPDAPNYPSSSFGMHQYLNQSSYMMPGGQKGADDSRLS